MVVCTSWTRRLYVYTLWVSWVQFEENKIIKEGQLKTMLFSSFLPGCEWVKSQQLWWNLSFGTLLLKGHLCSRDTVLVTSIEGTPPFRGHSICHLYWRETSIQVTQYMSPLLKGHLHLGDTVFVTSIEGTPPFKGHFHLGGTGLVPSIEGTPLFREHSICHLYWRDTSIHEKGTSFLGPECWI